MISFLECLGFPSGGGGAERPASSSNENPLAALCEGITDEGLRALATAGCGPALTSLSLEGFPGAVCMHVLRILLLLCLPPLVSNSLLKGSVPGAPW